MKALPYRSAGRSPRALVVIASATLLGGGCAAPPRATIDIGTCTSLVSLAPSLTELLVDMGAAERIVGVTRYDRTPLPAGQWRAVGGLIDPDLETIASIAPRCLVHISGSGSLAARLTPLRTLGVRIVEIEVTALADLPGAATRLGEITALAEQAARVRARIADDTEQVRHLFAAGLCPAGGPRALRPALFLYGKRPFVAAGPHSFGDELLTGPCFRNIITRGPRYPVLEAEVISQERPQYIFDASGEGGASGELERLADFIGAQVVPIGDERLRHPGPGSMAAWCHTVMGLGGDTAARSRCPGPPTAFP